MPQDLTPLSPTTAAGNSTDIVVTAPTTIFLYTANGLFPSGVQCPVYRKKGANYEPACDEKGNRIFLTHERREVTAYANGTYRVGKGATAYAVGVGKDS